MEEARFRALTHQYTFPVSPDQPCRNGRSPIQGIDTFHFPNKINLFCRRNGRSPIQGIDTLRLLYNLRLHNCVEKEEARLSILLYIQ